MATLTSEENAVLEVIQEEHRAFWMKDAAAFERCHLHSPESLRWGYWQAGGIMVRSGWEEIGKRSLEHMALLPRPVPEFAEAGFRNLRLRVGFDMAWANFERDHPRSSLPPGFGPNGPTDNIRILEKHNGRWLIAVMGLLDPHLGDEIAVRVAEDATVVWASDGAVTRLKHDEAFIIRSGRLVGRNQTLQGRLQKAIAWTASLDRHLMPRRGAIPLFLQSDSGKPRTVWVLADLGGALVLLEDSRPMAERIELATHTYGLSASQAKLALALSEGQSLADFSQLHAVTANTARTHLKRMFEKVGVTSQAGLVRALISLSPPR